MYLEVMLILFVLWCGVLLIRNLNVLEFLLLLGLRIQDAGMRAIHLGSGDQCWRFRHANRQATQMQMVFQFWRPLTVEEWYPDPCFLDIDASDPDLGGQNEADHT